MNLQLIDGVQCSETGIPLAYGVRCSHGVMDGDKPLTKDGPRCLKCLEAWKPLVRKEDLGGGLRDSHFCPECGERLHVTYSPKTRVVRDEELGFLRTEDYYAPHCWSHDAPRGCVRSAFPVAGYEEHYNGYGWGNWEEHASFLVRQFQDGLERQLLAKERYSFLR